MNTTNHLLFTCVMRIAATLCIMCIIFSGCNSLLDTNPTVPPPFPATFNCSAHYSDAQEHLYSNYNWATVTVRRADSVFEASVYMTSVYYSEASYTLGVKATSSNHDNDSSYVFYGPTMFGSGGTVYIDSARKNIVIRFRDYLFAYYIVSGKR